jgi:hypothetical protein
MTDRVPYPETSVNISSNYTQSRARGEQQVLNFSVFRPSFTQKIRNCVCITSKFEVRTTALLAVGNYEIARNSLMSVLGFLKLAHTQMALQNILCRNIR